MRAFRYVIDIIVIALAYFGLDAAADALPLPNNFRIVILVSTLAKCVFLVFIWFWLRLRGDSVATIGLKKPRGRLLSIVGGAVVAAVLFIAVYLLERAGFRRDMSAFGAFKGNLQFTLYQLAGIIIGAGFWRRVSVPRFSLSAPRDAFRRHQCCMGHSVSDPGTTVRVVTCLPEPARYVAHRLDRPRHGSCLPLHGSQPLGADHRSYALRHRPCGRLLSTRTATLVSASNDYVPNA